MRALLLLIASTILTLAACRGGDDVRARAVALRDRVVAMNAHVVVLKTTPDFPEYRDVLAIAASIHPAVIAAEPFDFVEAIAGSDPISAPAGIALKGVDPARVGAVLDLGPRMTRGSLAALAGADDPSGAAPVVIGDALARQLHVDLGAPLQIWQGPAWIFDAEPPRRALPCRVVGIFHTGFDEYDRRMVLAPRDATNQLIDRGDHVMGIELRLSDPDRSGAVTAALQARLGPDYVVEDWYELNRALFEAAGLAR